MKKIILLALIAFWGFGFWNSVAMNSEINALSMDTLMKKNILGTELESCCTSPVTGFYRDGYCRTGPEDRGTHVVCARMTEDFLTFTKSKGNDLSSPAPQYNFPGLNPGDCWCLCALRWKEAKEAGHAPPVNLKATEETALKYIKLETLQEYAL